MSSDVDGRMRLVIDRSRWRRGDHQDGALRNRDGTRCCLGFLAEACGYAVEETLEVLTPRELIDGLGGKSLFPSRLILDVESPDELLIDANDKPCEPSQPDFEPKREARIAELMSSIGVDVEFVDGR